MMSEVLCPFGFEICTSEGRGEKREGMQYSKLCTQNISPKKYLQPCIAPQRGEEEKREGVQISKQSTQDL